MGRYTDLRELRNNNPNVGVSGSLYYKNPIYPEVPLSSDDIYVETEFGDRLDLLANQFYNDVNLYWIISISNPDKVSFGSISVPEGTQLRIPTNIVNIVDTYNRLNR